MKKTTTTSLIFGAIGALITGGAAIAGSLAKRADSIKDEAEKEIEDLNNTQEDEEVTKEMETEEPTLEGEIE